MALWHLLWCGYWRQRYSNYDW